MDGREELNDAAFDRLLATEDSSFWFRARNRLLLGALDRHFPHAASLLEVGCGNGYVLSGFSAQRPKMRLVGSDLSELGLRHARARLPDATLIRADARDLTFDQEFDVVGAFDILEHVAEDRRVLTAMRRSVRVGGGVMITVPQHRWLFSETDRFSGHQRRYSRRELEGKLADAGIRLRQVTSFVSLLLPIMVASRAWQPVSRRPFDPAREQATARPVEGLLERAMDIETAAIIRGARLPAGGSLLAIGERV